MEADGSWGWPIGINQRLLQIAAASCTTWLRLSSPRRDAPFQEALACRSNAMETEMAAAKKEGTLRIAQIELVRGQRQLEELQSQSFAQEELREELRSLGERNEALREQLRTLHQEILVASSAGRVCVTRRRAQETRKVSERVDREVADHIEVQRHDVEANKAKLGDSSEIRRQLAQASSRSQAWHARAALGLVREMLPAGAPDAEGESQDQSERALEASKKSSHRTEERSMERGASFRLGTPAASASGGQAVEQLTVQFREDVFRQSQRHLELEGLIEDRNNEIKLLMYRLQDGLAASRGARVFENVELRGFVEIILAFLYPFRSCDQGPFCACFQQCQAQVQELSSRYVPVKADATDMVLSRWINGYRPAVPFFRLAQGLYLFGRRQVVCKISNDKPVFRIGGGFVGFEKLLTYELDEKTGEPKFLVAKQLLEESGVVEEIRQKVTEDVQRGKTGLQSSMSKKSLNSSRGSL
eukprot:s10110_g3.t1